MVTALVEQHDDVAGVSMKGSTIIARLRKEVEDYSFLPSRLLEEASASSCSAKGR